MPLSKVMQMTEAEWDEKLAGVDKSKVRSIHWFPYDRVRVVNADP
jgi:hypothetical protein